MMITKYLGRRQWARCPATTDVMATECEKLVTVPDPLDPVRLDLTCELAAGHEDSHVAFAVAARGGNQLWWLRWAERLRDLVQIDLCEGEDADERDVCLLPHGHRGPHSFEIQPVQEPGEDSALRQSSAYLASAGQPAVPRRHPREAG